VIFLVVLVRTRHELLVHRLDLRKTGTVRLADALIDRVVDVVEPPGQGLPGRKVGVGQSEGSSGLAVLGVTLTAVLARQDTTQRSKELHEHPLGLLVGLLWVGEGQRVQKHPRGRTPHGRLKSSALSHSINL